MLTVCAYKMASRDYVWLVKYHFMALVTRNSESLHNKAIKRISMMKNDTIIGVSVVCSLEHNGIYLLILKLLIQLRKHGRST